MSSLIFNQTKTDFTKQPMFFGEPLNMQRYDTFKYPIFEKLTKTMLSFFWRPEEVSLQKDRTDYTKLTEAEKFIFTSNLKYQILLDSVQGRGPIVAFLPYVSLPELEGCLITWDFFETIHSRSYTYIIENLYNNSSVLYDGVMEEQEIMERATSVTGFYDAFISYAKKLEARYDGEVRLADLDEAEQKELFRRLYLALIAVNILEGIRFYVSFACSFAFGENKLMEGSAKILSLIARDENIHLTITQHIINKYRDEENNPVMHAVMKECRAEAEKMFRDAVEEEKRWAAHLFKSGSMIGLNERLLCDYVEYLANRRLRAIGLGKMFDQPLNHSPLPWMSNWLSSKALQEAPQETEKESYLVGSLKQDVDEDTLSGFSL